MKYISYLGIAPALSLALASGWHYLWFFFGWPGLPALLPGYMGNDVTQSAFDLYFVQMLIVSTAFVYLCTHMLLRRCQAQFEG